jgi:hypothetical protein
VARLSPENASPARTDGKQSPKAQNTGRQSRGLIGNALRSRRGDRSTFCLVQSCVEAENSRMSTIAATEFLPLVATAAATRDFMVVSLHDVAPPNQQIANTIISELARRGVSVCSLLAVPDYHHQGLFTRNQQFVSWLRGLEADGHEIVIHGYFHERPRRAKESLHAKFLTRFYTEQEGEFYDLGYDEALSRITRARDEFRASGLKSRGFVAPAWLLSKEEHRFVTGLWRGHLDLAFSAVQL